MLKSEVKLKFKDRAITANMMWYEKKGNKKIETFLNYTQDTHGGKYKHIVCHVKMKGKNGLNKAYPYRNPSTIYKPSMNQWKR